MVEEDESEEEEESELKVEEEELEEEEEGRDRLASVYCSQIDRFIDEDGRSCMSERLYPGILPGGRIAFASA